MEQRLINVYRNKFMEEDFMKIIIKYYTQNCSGIVFDFEARRIYFIDDLFQHCMRNDMDDEIWLYRKFFRKISLNTETLVMTFSPKNNEYPASKEKYFSDFVV